MTSNNEQGFEVVRLGGNIGAEIRGSTCASRCPRRSSQALHAAFVKHEVLVYRDQDISLEEQMAFGQLFGELSIHPFSPNLDDKREVIVLDYSADNPPALTDQWHADETFRAAPPSITILRSKVVPSTAATRCSPA
jgi:taurine dioxygenase